MGGYDVVRGEVEQRFLRDFRLRSEQPGNPSETALELTEQPLAVIRGYCTGQSLCSRAGKSSSTAFTFSDGALGFFDWHLTSVELTLWMAQIIKAAEWLHLYIPRGKSQEVELMTPESLVHTCKEEEKGFLKNPTHSYFNTMSSI